MTFKTDSIIVGTNSDDTRNFLLDTDLAGGLRIRRRSDGSGGVVLAFDASGNRTSWKSGEIIQTQAYTDAGGSSTTNGSYANVTASIKNFTPRSTNSTLIVECEFGVTVGLIPAVNTYGYAVLFDNTNSVAFGSNPTFGVANSPGGNSLNTIGSCAGALPNSALTARQFSLRAQSSNGQAVTCANHFWKITEVQN